MNKKKFALILLGIVVVAVVVLNGSFSTGVIKYDDEIDPALRAQMQERNLALLSALRDQEYDVVLGLFGPNTDREQTRNSLMKASDQLESLIGSAEFENFHDHHVSGLAGDGATNTVWSEHALSDEPGSYFIYHNADTQNAYISLFTSEADQRELLYTIVWGEYEDGWKIQALDFAAFGWGGKRGPDWLEEVEQIRQGSGDIAAYLTLEAVSGLFHPSPVFAWKDLESRVKLLSGEIAKSLAPKFGTATIVQELDSKPQIYGLDAVIAEDQPGQVIPVILYVTKYEISQVDLVEDEAHQMAPHMEKYFEGVSDLGDYLLFAAYEEAPTDPEKQYSTHRTVVKVD